MAEVDCVAVRNVLGALLRLPPRLPCREEVELVYQSSSFFFMPVPSLPFIVRWYKANLPQQPLACSS